MIRSIFRKLFLSILFLPIFFLTKAQGENIHPVKTYKDSTLSNPAKPFRVLTSGKRITIQGSQPIKRILGWTASGHRFIENNNVDAVSCNFELPGGERFAFIMIQMKDGRHFTEKIGAE
jgi:hypothetical protein